MKGGPQKQILRELSITFVATIPVYRPIEQVYNLRVWFRLTGLASSEKKQYEKGRQQKYISNS